MTTTLALRSPKTCNTCGAVHISATGTVCEHGHLWFHCGCGSTLVEPSWHFWAVQRIVAEAENRAIGEHVSTAVRDAMAALGLSWDDHFDVYEDACDMYGRKLERAVMGRRT